MVRALQSKDLRKDQLRLMHHCTIEGSCSAAGDVVAVEGAWGATTNSDGHNLGTPGYNESSCGGEVTLLLQSCCARSSRGGGSRIWCARRGRRS